MSAALSDRLKQVLDGRVFVTLATIQPDGSPHASPMWVKRDGDDLLISTTTNRRKYLNLQRDPRVSVVVIDPESPYDYAQIRGTVQLIEEGAYDLIDDLARKYTGANSYPEWNPASSKDAPRVVVRITPRRIVGMGNLT